jgi:Abnormal spindle-like microcephaly-assoc'd, ASPM-SPD-2-Hydin
MFHQWSPSRRLSVLGCRKCDWRFRGCSPRTASWPGPQLSIRPVSCEPSKLYAPFVDRCLQKGRMILFPAERTLNQPQASAIARDQNSLRRNTRAWEWGCALFCLMATAGCAGLGSPSTSPTLSGIDQLSASPGSVDFGSVGVGVSSKQTVIFSNTGTGSLTISQAAVSGAGFTMTGQTFPLTLSAGQTSSINVQFAPTVSGGATGSVSVVSNAANSPTTIALSGTGVQLTAHSAALSWTASTSVVTGYNVYRGTVTGGPYTLLNASFVILTDYSDNTVLSGQTYFYVVTAVDANNVESAYSNEVSAVIPFP